MAGWGRPGDRLLRCGVLCAGAGERLTFSSAILPGGAVRLFLPNALRPSAGEDVLVCWKLWTTAAANVVCREHGHPL